MILGHANIAVTLGIYSEVFDTEITSALIRMNHALACPETYGLEWPASVRAAC